MRKLLLALALVLLSVASVDAANRFLTCPVTCTITPSDTTIWGTTSGGVGASVPGSSDAVILDAATCVGGVTCTVTMNFGGTWTIQSLTMGACTASTTGCIFDNSVNNNNITMTASGGTAFSGSGSGVRTYKLGTATYTISGVGASFTTLTTTNLTYTGNTDSTIAFTGIGTSQRTFSGGSVSHGTVTINSITGAANSLFNGSNTIQNLIVTAPNRIWIQNSTTLTIVAAFTITGTQANQIELSSGVLTATATIAAAAGSTAQWCGIHDIIVTGNTLVATNSFNLGNNTNITITAPQALGSGGGFIGGN